MRPRIEPRSSSPELRSAPAAARSGARPANPLGRRGTAGAAPQSERAREGARTRGSPAALESREENPSRPLGPQPVRRERAGAAGRRREGGRGLGGSGRWGGSAAARGHWGSGGGRRGWGQHIRSGGGGAEKKWFFPRLCRLRCGGVVDPGWGIESRRDFWGDDDGWMAINK
ncbi:hypothetical protein ZWY2020_005375 [Hordeum vulgare]|nr:hypothetical protein ZWY2020_005375 [Hordeum vulgare]